MLFLSLAWFLTWSCSIFRSHKSYLARSPPCFPATASPTFDQHNWRAQPANSLQFDLRISVLTPLCLFMS